VIDPAFGYLRGNVGVMSRLSDWTASSEVERKERRRRRRRRRRRKEETGKEEQLDRRKMKTVSHQASASLLLR